MPYMSDALWKQSEYSAAEMQLIASLSRLMLEVLDSN